MHQEVLGGDKFHEVRSPVVGLVSVEAIAVLAAVAVAAEMMK